MSTTIANTPAVEALDTSVVATFRNHGEAEEAVRRLEHGGIPLKRISIIGRDFQLREDIQGYYRPSDAVVEGAGTGAWVGGLFGMLLGFGFFLVPGIGAVLALGPLAGLIAGAVGGAGIGALANGLMALGMSKDQALKYQARVTAGEFLVVVQGTQEEVERARQILDTTNPIQTQVHTQQEAVTA